MSEQNTGTDEQQTTDEGAKSDAEETPTVEDLLQKVADLTTHSRKWEDRAKANKTKAEELDALRAESMTAEEKAQAALTDAETRATSAEERAATAEAALARYTIATEFGLNKEDAEALSAVSDPDALRALAERLADRAPSGPQPNPAQGRSRGNAPTTPGQAFSDALSELF